MKKMKNFGQKFMAVALLAITAFVAQSFTSVPEPNYGFIILPASTPISFEAMETISSEELESGHDVDFRVRKDVTVNNIVVIKAGSIATGMVKKVVKADKSCTTCPPKGCAHLQIMVETVQAIDGTDVRVRSTPLDIKGCCENCPAQLTIGKTISAAVASNTKINL